MSLTPNQIYSSAVAAGFAPGDAVTLTAIILAESGGNPAAHNHNVKTGDDSWGLAQINMLGAMGPERRQQYGLRSNEQLADPMTNLRVAHGLSGGGKNFTPWSTYKSGAYKQYLGQAQNAARGGTGAAVGATTGAVDLAAETGGETAAPEMGPGARLNSMMDTMGGNAPPVLTAAAPVAFPAGVTTNLEADQTQPEATATTGDASTAAAPAGGSGPASGAITSAVKAAQNKTPYVWGGNSLGAGVDCSGLIQQAYASVGINLPRVSNQQIAAGQKVPVEQMQPGDILGWVYDNSLGGGATHVAMYIGGGMMVEALHKGEPVHVVPVRKPHVVSRPVAGGNSGAAAGAQPLVGRQTEAQPELDPNASGWGRLAAMANAMGAMANQDFMT